MDRSTNVLPREPKLFIASIDLGTTTSGCALVYMNDLNQHDDTDIIAPCLNIPTSILFDQKKNFHSFGVTAEEKYAELEEQRKNWFFFRHFKHELRGEMSAVVKDFLLEEIGGKRLPAIEVFSAAILYLKGRCYASIMGEYMRDDYILWVITVPEKWNGQAKQFIRESATKAGIKDTNLLLVLESEAASAYCRWLKIDLPKATPCKQSAFCLGTEYIVIDAGGDTVDITFHKVNTDGGGIYESHRVSTLDLGNNTIEKAFFKLLSDVFGDDVMGSFMKAYPHDALNMLRDFEVRTKASENDKIQLRCPVSLKYHFTKTKGMDIISYICSNKHPISVVADKLRIESSIIIRMFDNVTTEIIEELRSLLKKAHFRDDFPILMVGGFSKSHTLQQRIKTVFPRAKRISLKNPETAVLFGALVCGYNPENHDTSLELNSVQSSPIIAAAIDFGTSNSGYAFSMVAEPKQIYAELWQTPDGLRSNKTPTCILFDDNKKFHAFGFEAEDKYAELATMNKHEGWYYFRLFKMDLYSKHAISLEITDITGQKSIPAVDVFSASIRYMANRLLDLYRKHVSGTEDDIEFVNDIMWVITVPAIWTDTAKQFMREAARQGGLADNRIMLALEPEAASVYCRATKLDKKATQSTYDLPTLRSRAQYLVLDAGGGTVDFTVHQIGEDGTLIEMYKATGGDWGGTFVNKAFWDLMSDIYGTNVIEEWRKHNMDEYLELDRAFELKKRYFSLTVKNVVIPISSELGVLYKECNDGKDVKNSVTNTRFGNEIEFVRNKLLIGVSVFKKLFDGVTTGIVGHLEMLLQQEHVRDVSTILMVGGFSDSQLLQESIRKTFCNMRVIVPPEASATVLKGAVLYGHDPGIISERRCRFTYGFAITKPISSIDKRFHARIPETKKVTGKDGSVRVRDVFDKHVTVGQHIKKSEKQVEKYYYSANGSDLCLQLFISDEEDPLFVTEMHSVYLGELIVKAKQIGFFERVFRRRKPDTDLAVCINFGDTELSVEVRKEDTGEILDAKFMLLD